MKGSTRTVENIVKESVLIDVFRNCHLTLEKNFVLSQLTTLHTEPDMTATYAALHRHMDNELLLEFKPGRSTKYKIPDVIDSGLNMLLQTTGTEADQSAEVAGLTDDWDMQPGIEDVSVDLDM